MLPTTQLTAWGGGGGEMKCEKCVMIMMMMVVIINISRGNGLMMNDEPPMYRTDSRHTELYNLNLLCGNSGIER